MPDFYILLFIHSCFFLGGVGRRLLRCHGVGKMDFRIFLVDATFGFICKFFASYINFNLKEPVKCLN